MGHELQYETNLCGIHSSELHSLVKENEDYKRRIEEEIFALILMDPAKVRNKRRKSKKDDYDDDDEWLNNAQYLTRLWGELKEQWEDAWCHIIRCSDAEEAVEHPYKEIDVCPDCHCEIEWIKKEVEVTDEDYQYTRCKDVYECPKCGKQYNYREDGYSEGEEPLPMPMVIKVRTWSEG